MIDQYIRLYGRRLFGLCLSLCANVQEAEDLYQDTWLKVLQSIARYDKDMPFEPWLTQICVNTYRNQLRRLKRSPFLHFTSNETKDAALSLIAAPERPDYTDLYRAIDQLPEKLRLAVILFYFRDMDTAATAAALHIPEGTVKSRLNKARKQLKEVLGDGTDLQF